MLRDESIDLDEERGGVLHDHGGEDLELQHLNAADGAEGQTVARDIPDARFKGSIRKTRRPGSRHASWERFKGLERKRVGIVESLNNVATSSYLNVLFIVHPFAWAAHFADMSHRVTFVLCFIAMIPLEKMFEWGGQQLALYCGTGLGDLIIVTLNNVIEAVLAIILLVRCELKLLQSTVVGVIVLHLLLIPGMTFLTGGSKIWEQQLHPHTTQMNQSVLILGVMALVLPSAYFAALDRGFTIDEETAQVLVNDTVRGEFLQMSRASAFFLLNIYLCSRIFLHNPPGENNTIISHPSAPEALKQEELHLEEEDPEVNPWVCVIVLVITVALVALDAQFLVESIKPLRESNHIGDEWFGVILLPILSFSADGTVAIVYFVRELLRTCFGTAKPSPPSELAKARTIDMSIQFVLFWFPLFVLVAWWTNRPLVMLFDLYEIALLVTSAFLVNYITQDARTNWVEGATLVVFYCLIALWTWFYVGQEEVKVMLACKEDVAMAIAGLTTSEGE